MDEPMVKIIVAADEVGVTYKTIYNWLEEGTLKLAHPGFVFMSEVRKVLVQKQNTRVDISRAISSKFTRDDYGRFKLLTGAMNNKPYNDID
jgi:predicted site-specific integrase-resolvase